MHFGVRQRYSPDDLFHARPSAREGRPAILHQIPHSIIQTCRTWARSRRPSAADDDLHQNIAIPKMRKWHLLCEYLRKVTVSMSCINRKIRDNTSRQTDAKAYTSVLGETLDTMTESGSADRDPIDDRNRLETSSSGACHLMEPFPPKEELAEALACESIIFERPKSPSRGWPFLSTNMFV